MIQQVYLTNSCPLINGEAVFGARNLLSSIKGEKFYNDKVICSSQGYTYKTKQEKEAIPGVLEDLLISIFPNPVKELLSINLSKMIKGDITIEIRDLLGRNILNEKRNELLKTEVDLKVIPDGFYMVSVKNNELTIYNEKIYVQK